MPRLKIEGITKADMFKVDPRIIIVRDDWNERKDFEGHESLVESIIENGVINPIRIQRDEDKLLLVDGERRLRATMEAIRRGVNIVSIPALMVRPSMSETEAKYTSYLANDGKRFTPLEECELFDRLLKYGESVSDISKKIGKSTTYVNNTLLFRDGNKDLKEGVKDGKIKKTLAQNIIKKSAGDKNKEEKLTKEALIDPKKVSIPNKNKRKISEWNEAMKEMDFDGIPKFDEENAKYYSLLERFRLKNKYNDH